MATASQEIFGHGFPSGRLGLGDTSSASEVMFILLRCDNRTSRVHVDRDSGSLWPSRSWSRTLGNHVVENAALKCALSIFRHENGTPPVTRSSIW